MSRYKYESVIPYGVDAGERAAAESEREHFAGYLGIRPEIRWWQPRHGFAVGEVMEHGSELGGWTMPDDPSTINLVIGKRRGSDPDEAVQARVRRIARHELAHVVELRLGIPARIAHIGDDGTVAGRCSDFARLWSCARPDPDDLVVLGAAQGRRSLDLLRPGLRHLLTGEPPPDAAGAHDDGHVTPDWQRQAARVATSRALATTATRARTHTRTPEVAALGLGLGRVVPPPGWTPIVDPRWAAMLRKARKAVL